MREIVARNAAFAREEWDRDEAIAFFEERGENYKAELIRGPAARRGDLALSPGRLDRPVPRPAPALDRRCRPGLQADEGGRRLLARRPPQRHAQPHLRHRLARPEGARRLPAHAGGGGEARPPPHRPRARACSTCRKRRSAACSGIPKGWKLYRTAEEYMRRRLDDGRLCRGEDAAAGRPLAVGGSPATGRSSASTCSSRASRTRTGPTRSSR